MDQEIKPQVLQTNKFPKSLTTVTPFFKAVAMSMYIVFPILGFYFGILYQKQVAIPANINKNISDSSEITFPTSQSPTSAPEKEVDCDPKLLCVDGKVYYTNNNGKQVLIAKEVNDLENPENSTSINFASLSPNEKFISIGSTQLGFVSFDIYEIKTGEFHSTSATGLSFGDWLPDNRILVIGGCGMGIDCGIFVSNDSQEPWKMSQVFDAPVSWRR